MRQQPPERRKCYRCCYRMLPLCYRCWNASGNIFGPRPSLMRPHKSVMLPMLPLFCLHKHLNATLRARGVLELPGGQNDLKRTSATPRARGGKLGLVCIEKGGNIGNIGNIGGRWP